jgi:hypothetical protein
MAVRYETIGTDLWVLWEDDNGNRWYEIVVKNGEVQW